MENIIWLADPEVIKKIGDKIKEYRLEMDMAQKDLAKKAGLSLATVQKIERGGGGTIANLVRVLRVTGRLQALEPFMEERRITPLEYSRMMGKTHTRKRAGRHGKNTDDNPVW